MAVRPEERLIYHITDVENLSPILADGGLFSDAVVSQRHPALIGHNHIKERRLTQIRVTSCVEASYWAENRHQKQAELLAADFFPWTGLHEVGCQNKEVADEVTRLLTDTNHRPKVSVRVGWYY